MLQTDSKHLLQRLKELDLDALAETYDRYSEGLYSYAVHRLGDDSLAEDCVAETYSRFLKSLHQGKGPDTYIQAYLYRIAHNWITDYYRDIPRQPVEIPDEHPSDTGLDPENQSHLSWMGAQMRKALRNLTPEQQQVISLRFFEEWDVELVAKTMNKPEGAIKALQHRALSSLKRMLVEKEE